MGSPIDDLGAARAVDLPGLTSVSPGKIIRGPTPPKMIFPDSTHFKDELLIDDMDLKGIVELLMDEIDSLNKRVESLETKRS